MNCANCGKELEMVYPERSRRSGDFPQYKGALVVTLSGGYGMLFDDLDEGNNKVNVLCAYCGTAFLAQNKWALVPENAL